MIQNNCYICVLDSHDFQTPAEQPQPHSSHHVQDSQHEVILSDDHTGKNYHVLKTFKPTSFSSLVPPLHSNRKAAIEAFERMRAPCVKKRQDNENRQKEQDENICQACNVVFDDDNTGVEWLQCMECNRWSHKNCGRCTVGTFFCKFCVNNVLEMLSV